MSGTPPVVPGYRVEQRLGAGTSGEVWRARDVLTGRLVALKRLAHDGPPGERDRLRREAAVLAGLASQHLVRLLTVVTSSDGLVLVLEFHGGGTLASLLAARRLTAGELVTVAAPLADALADAHHAGVVHGDVSAANVLFAVDGRPVLADLGLAALTGQPPSDATTVAYAAPELLRGAAARPAADVHALAAVCWHALVGRPPEQPRPPLRELRPELPTALVAAVESALHADPSARPDAAAFARALRAACPAEPVRLAGATVPADAPRTTRVQRLPAAPEPAPAGARPRSLRAGADAAAHARRTGSVVRRRLSSRVLVAAVAGPCALAAAVWGGVAWARSGSSSAPATWPADASGSTTPSVAPTRPQAQSAQLDPTSEAAITVPVTSAPVTPAPATSQPTTVAAATSAAKTSVASDSAPAMGVPAAMAAGTAASSDLAAALRRLDTLRDTAFATGDPAVLSAVYAPGSPPLAADLATLRQLATAGERARGLHLTVTDVTVLRRSGATVTLAVHDRLDPYTIVTTSGRVVASAPGRGPTSWRITLTATTAGLRISAITKAS